MNSVESCIVRTRLTMDEWVTIVVVAFVALFVAVQQFV